MRNYASVDAGCELLRIDTDLSEGSPDRIIPQKSANAEIVGSLTNRLHTYQRVRP